MDLTGFTFAVPGENVVLSRKTYLEKESTLPLQCVYQENAKEQKVDQQTFPKAERMEGYDLKDTEVSLTMQIFGMIITTCVITCK